MMRIPGRCSIGLWALCLFLTAHFAAWGQEGSTSVPSFPTGPQVGERIPAFAVVDRLGRRQTFDSLKGPRGLLLLFHRSADW